MARATGAALAMGDISCDRVLDYNGDRLWPLPLPCGCIGRIVRELAYIVDFTASAALNSEGQAEA